MTLFRYVLREYFKFVLGTILLVIFLFVLFDFIHKTTNYFARHNPSAELIIKFYIFQLPFQMVQSLPIASLLGSVVSMVVLNRSNEVTAMRAAGMGPWQIGAPLVVGGLILSLLAYGLSEFVVPYSSQRMHYVTEVQIEGRDADGVDELAHWHRQGQEVFNFEDYDHQTETMRGVKLVTIGRGFVPQKAMHADSAVYQAAAGLWNLQGVRHLSFQPNGALTSLKRVDTLAMKLPVEPKKLKTERRLPDEMSLGELGELIYRGQGSGADVLALRIAWHVKWAYPLAAFLISLLGIKFGYRSERTTETVRSVLVAFGLGISYWFVLSAARALAGAGDLPPMLAAWSANLVIAAIVVSQMWKVYRT